MNDRANNKALGDLAQAVVAHSVAPGRWARKMLEFEHVKKTVLQRRHGDRYLPVKKAALQESTGATGGFLVPVQTELAITKILEQKSPFWQHGYVQPMATETMVVPGVDITAGNAQGTPVEYGGIAATWGQEAVSLSESEPSFTGPKLTAKNLQCYVVASNQLVWDGGEALGAYLMQVFSKVLLWQTTYAFFQGVGATNPNGIVNSAAAVSQARGSGNVVATVDLAKMAGAMLPCCYDNAVWAMNPSAYVQVAQLSTYLISGHVPPKDGNHGMVGAILTRPVYLTDQLPKLGSSGDVVFFDPSMYCVGFRSLEIASSEVPNFTKNQTVFRLIWRGDGQLIAKGTTTLADGNTTAGVAVYLHS